MTGPVGSLPPVSGTVQEVTWGDWLSGQVFHGVAWRGESWIVSPLLMRGCPTFGTLLGPVGPAVFLEKGGDALTFWARPRCRGFQVENPEGNWAPTGSSALSQGLLAQLPNARLALCLPPAVLWPGSSSSGSLSSKLSRVPLVYARGPRCELAENP